MGPRDAGSSSSHTSSGDGNSAGPGPSSDGVRPHPPRVSPENLDAPMTDADGRGWNGKDAEDSGDDGQDDYPIANTDSGGWSEDDAGDGQDVPIDNPCYHEHHHLDQHLNDLLDPHLDHPLDHYPLDHPLDHHSHHLHESAPPFFVDSYPPETFDMSDDGGAPLVSILDVANLLTNDVEMDAGAGGLGGHPFGGYDDEYDDDEDDEDDDDDDGAVGGVGVGHYYVDLVGEEGDGYHTHAPPGQPAIFQGQAPPPPPPLPQTIPNPLLAETAWEFAAATFGNPATLQNPGATPATVAQQLEMLAENMDDDDDGGPGGVPGGVGGGFTLWLPGGHPVALSNPNPTTLGGGNYGLVDFLKHWAGLRGLDRDRGRVPWTRKINDQAQTHLTHVQYADLEGDQCDMQGVDWEDLGVTRREARARRLQTYTNYVNRDGSDRWNPRLPDMVIPRTDSFFRFRRMDIRRNVQLWHFQLRNTLACASRSQAFYTGNGVVHSFNPTSGEGGPFLKLADSSASQISTLAADYGVLIAGGFNGDYVLRHLESDYYGGSGDSDGDEDPYTHEGTITHNVSGITNHVQIHAARGAASPRAAFASNDMRFRVMDIATETFLSREDFAYPLNCTALSPDRRLRVMVGDYKNVLIAAAESTHGAGRPEIVQELTGHRDHGFACAWADDGWTVATGFQDRAVKIWDARRWTDASGAGSPVCTLRTEMAGVRSLSFSPVGSGRRVLVAAEEADFINIIDARTFRSKQTVDIFGEIGGVAFTNGGQDLTALCCDKVRGGLLQLERCGLGAETAFWDRDAAAEDDDDDDDDDESQDDTSYDCYDRRRLRRSHHATAWRRPAHDDPRLFDWPRSRFTESKRIRESVSKRRRKGASLDVEPF